MKDVLQGPKYASFLPFLDKINAFVKNAAIIIFKLNLDIGLK